MLLSDFNANTLFCKRLLHHFDGLLRWDESLVLVSLGFRDVFDNLLDQPRETGLWQRLSALVRKHNFPVLCFGSPNEANNIVRIAKGLCKLRKFAVRLSQVS